jgi:hypothetical protein
MGKFWNQITFKMGTLFGQRILKQVSLYITDHLTKNRSFNIYMTSQNSALTPHVIGTVVS